eukprot:7601818-Alexandrium_andersonii.AAC.1
MSASLVGSEMCIRDSCTARNLPTTSETPKNADPSNRGDARSATLLARASEKRSSDLCKFRVAERAVWLVRRAGNASSQAGFGAQYPTLTEGVQRACGWADNQHEPQGWPLWLGGRISRASRGHAILDATR